MGKALTAGSSWGRSLYQRHCPRGCDYDSRVRSRHYLGQPLQEDDNGCDEETEYQPGEHQLVPERDYPFK